MKRSNLIPGLCVLVLLCGTTCFGQRSITMPEAASVNSLQKEYHVPVVGISIIDKGKITQVKMFGDLPHHSPTGIGT